MGQMVEQSHIRSSNRPTTTTKDEGVRKFMDRFARALTAGDGKTIATMWAIPALVIGESGMKAVSSRDEVERFFSGAKDEYNKRGIMEARPVIKRVDWLTPKMVLVDVRWPYIDQNGKEIGSESSVYTLVRDEQGELKMACIMMRGEEQPSAAV